MASENILTHIAASAVCAAAIAACGAALAQQQAPAAAPKTEQAADDAYVPPMPGAPQRRVGGATRGVGRALPTVVVLAPNHAGLTTVEQPELYWYISAPTRVRVD